MNKLDDLLDILAKAPDSQIDKDITPLIRELIGQPPSVVAEKLIVIRNDCAFSSLASDFGMFVLGEAIEIAKRIEDGKLDPRA